MVYNNGREQIISVYQDGSKIGWHLVDAEGVIKRICIFGMVVGGIMMRKMKLFIVLFFYLAFLCSCGRYSAAQTSQPETTLGTESDSDEAAAGDTTTEIESQSQEETEAVLDVVTGLTTYYIRGKDGSTSDAVSTLIRTEEDYKEYCEKEKILFPRKNFRRLQNILIRISGKNMIFSW